MVSKRYPSTTLWEMLPGGIRMTRGEGARRGAAAALAVAATPAAAPTVLERRAREVEACDQRVVRRLLIQVRIGGIPSTVVEHRREEVPLHRRLLVVQRSSAMTRPGAQQAAPPAAGAPSTCRAYHAAPAAPMRRRPYPVGREDGGDLGALGAAENAHVEAVVYGVGQVRTRLHA